MSVRNFQFTLSAYATSPKTIQIGSVQYEHNATQVQFIIPNDLYTLINGIGENKTILYRVDVVDGLGGYHPSETLEPTIYSEGLQDYQINYAVPYDIASVGGTCNLTVVATRIDENDVEEMIFCSETARIKFSQVARGEEQHTQAHTELSGLLHQAKGYMIESAEINEDGELFVKYVNGKTVSVGISNLLSADNLKAAIEATENANTAAQNAENAAQSANEAAADAREVRQGVEEGGFIESLKEQNDGAKFTVWVGKQEEYDAIPENERVRNCLYLINDAVYAAYPIEFGYAYEGSVYYEKYNNGIIKVYATVKCIRSTNAPTEASFAIYLSNVGMLENSIISVTTSVNDDETENLGTDSLTSSYVYRKTTYPNHLWLVIRKNNNSELDRETYTGSMTVVGKWK